MKKAINNMLFIVLMHNGFSIACQTAVSEHAQHLESIDSIEILAKQYFALNDFDTAYKLYRRSFEQKSKVLKERSLPALQALTNMAKTAIYGDNLELAKEHIQYISNQTMEDTTDYRFITPMIAFLNAKLHEKLGLREKAKEYYEAFLISAQQNKNLLLSEDYIDILTSISTFYVTDLGREKAHRYAHLALESARRESHLNTFIHLKALRNIANTYFASFNHKKGLQYSEQALQLFNEKLKDKGDIKHQVEIEKIIPYIILLNVKSKYFLSSKKDAEFLFGLAKQMEEGLKILNKNKSILLNPEDISVLFDDFGMYFSFAKQIHLDLFKLTQDEKHLIRLIQMHESVLYSKIRKRLHVIDDVALNTLPEAISEKEKFLKANLKKSLFHTSYNNRKYSDAERNWASFLDTLKASHPKYYKLIYASLEQKIEGLDTISPEETIVRYLFIEKRLYVMVLSKEGKYIFPLPFIDLALYNEKLLDYTLSAKELQPILNTLYHHLWKPIEDVVKTNKVIIIPDGPLFNLNFDLLTDAEIHSFKDLGSKALLSYHTISYNYSLFLYKSERKLLEYDKDFIAFAPEFNAKMKSNYQLAIADSVNLDRTYLSYLPQPFSSKIAEKFSRHFDGSSFLNKNASKQVFMNKAGEHKIIHIGTHAENNNVNPELSRLVFAKNISDSVNINDNYLYTYEIYNQNLSSQLTVLTACETGKPAYQPGEGMISLAHAFNYAGSESILTSLWQIDEQSSAQILDDFYGYLEEGLSKDKALKMAKFDYLASAEGRTLHPHYWAGLVLMGDTAPIELSKSSGWIWWLVLTFLVLFLVFLGVNYFLKVNKYSALHK